MVTINNSTVSSNIWETFYDDITALFPTKLVTNSFVDKPKDNFQIDQVVVNPVMINNNQLVLDRSRKDQEIIINISLYSKKNKSIDEMSDALRDWFESNEITYNDAGLYDMNIIDNSSDTIFVNEQKLHAKEFVVNFMREFIK